MLPPLAEEFAHRSLVFRHDPGRDYADELSSIDIPDFSVVAVADDEYTLKYRMLHEEPDPKFLTYRRGTVPEGPRDG
ncbi:hypothetical protein [Acidipropionibacterium virtanenii]|uniref:Uncharacterized protein n=1 Tax=Acidipropionibacterium virtanenii TaxID=2057246 RepID=A0A344URW8_9ACTN|nr:hypothetical protein [Acidipropionibacterium virtanenii]AXE38016.1 hypothetical protein JS278_00829 [Acidipropionibacterium virtanenii]